MSEITNEERAMEIIDAILTGLPEFRLCIVEKALTEAEERGRQSVQAPALVTGAKCKYCEGTGEIPLHHEYVPCNACHMTGIEGGRRVMPQQPPSEWADLSHLTGRELRDRLKSRARTFGYCIKLLNYRTEASHSNDQVDTHILIDLIHTKELAVTQEAEMRWSEHLDSFEPLLDEPDGAAKIVAALGHQYLGVIVDRRAEKKARALGIELPHPDELDLEIKTEVGS